MNSLKDIEEMAEGYLQKNGWNEWAKYVLLSLEELKKQYAEQEGKIDDNKDAQLLAISQLTTEVKVLQTRITQRASLYAALIAFLPTMGLVIYKLLS